MNLELGADYELLTEANPGRSSRSWDRSPSLSGAFLRENGTREYLSKGAEGLGWVALVAPGSWARR